MSLSSTSYSMGGPSQAIQPKPYKPMFKPQGRPNLIYANCVYYPNWKVYSQRPPSSMSLAYISHIFYAPTADGTISLSDEVADTEIEVDGAQGCIQALTQLKRQYPSLKIVLSIGGGGTGSAHFPRIASDNTLRTIFARSARTLVDMYDFDGIDIDWEHPSTLAEGASYLSLLSTTRQHLPSPNYILTSALPAASWALRHINLPAAALHLTFFNLMAYDFYGPWSPTSGHHAQLYSPPTFPASPSVSTAISYILALTPPIPPSKILLGIPCFGRAFPGAAGPNELFLEPTQIGGSTVDDRVFEYCELPLTGTTEHVDESVVGAWCLDTGAGNGWISYENAATLRTKAAFVRGYGLGGLFYWAGTGDVRGSRSLVEVGYESLHDL
ncbi:hypothetical protein MMC30_000165 [Trapelia coarctata]|nr:hypothetical protein [Trapelia coarctata]